MAQWTITTDGDGLRVQADGATVLSIAPDGVQLVALLSHTVSVDDLTAWAIRNNELTLQASSPPTPPGTGDVKLFLDGTTGHLALMDDAGQVWPFDPRLFAAAPVAEPKPAPPVESAR